MSSGRGRAPSLGLFRPRASPSGDESGQRPPLDPIATLLTLEAALLCRQCNEQFHKLTAESLSDDSLSLPSSLSSTTELSDATPMPKPIAGHPMELRNKPTRRRTSSATTIKAPQQFPLHPATFSSPPPFISTETAPSPSSTLPARDLPPHISTSPAMPTHAAPSNPPVKPASVATLPLLRGDGGDADKPLYWFSRFVLELHASGWSDAEKIERFELQLAPGCPAQKWFTDLSSSDTATFIALRRAFEKKWPVQMSAALPRRQQKQQLQGLTLMDGDIGKWQQTENGGDFMHNLWAKNVVKLAT